MKRLILSAFGLGILILIPAQMSADPPTDTKPQREPFRPPPLPGQPHRDPTRPFDVPPPPGPGAPIPPAGGHGDTAPARPEAPDEVVRALTAALKDNDLEVRKLAAATLVQLRQGKKATDTLVGLLNSPDADSRKFAVEHLAAAGADSVEALSEALKSKERDVRANAAYALARVGSVATDANASLLKLAKDEDVEVRRRVFYALNRIYAHQPNLTDFFPPGTFPPSGVGSGWPGDLGPQVPDPGVLAPPKKSEK